MYNKLTIHTGSSTHFTEIENIIWLSIFPYKTVFHLHTKSSIVKTGRVPISIIKELEYNGFMRIHKLYLINIRYVHQLNIGRHFDIILNTKTKLPVHFKLIRQLEERIEKYMHI